jgi:hypothetical protein
MWDFNKRETRILQCETFGPLGHTKYITHENSKPGLKGGVDDETLGLQTLRFFGISNFTSYIHIS